MKKLILLITIISLIGCSSDSDDNGINLSDKQKTALAVFKGSWADVQFSNLNSGQLAYLQPDPDRIVFTKHYQSPIGINARTSTFNAHGECSYLNVSQEDGVYEIDDCFYSVSEDGEHLSLYNTKDNSLLQTYELTIKSNQKFNLHDKRISLPYVFDKQSEIEETPTETYMPLRVYLEKGEIKNGEEITMYIYPPKNGELPEHYSSIQQIEYFVDGVSIGVSKESPFSIKYTPELKPGNHIISIRHNFSRNYAAWATQNSAFTIIE